MARSNNNHIRRTQSNSVHSPHALFSAVLARRVSLYHLGRRIEAIKRWEETLRIIGET